MQINANLLSAVTADCVPQSKQTQDMLFCDMNVTCSWLTVQVFPSISWNAHFEQDKEISLHVLQEAVHWLQEGHPRYAVPVV